MVGKAPRRFTSRGVSILPLLLMGVTHLSIPPLQSMFELEPMLMYGWYAIAVVLGLLLFRRSRVVKDHEYNRAKAMKKIRHVYEAEERGVWETNAQLDGTMDAVSKAGLKRTVGEFASESPELELEDGEKVDVQMLAEADHIVKANARVSGERTLDEERVTGTVGAQQKRSPMDRMLDAFWGLFGVDSAADREAKRQARLQRAAQQSPVIAQRPVAPLRLNKGADETEVNMTSMSDTGGHETVISTSGEVKEPGQMQIAQTKVAPPLESLESMAMLGQTPGKSVSIATAGPQCRGCKAPVGAEERYCPHCGLDL